MDVGSALFVAAFFGIAGLKAMFVAYYVTDTKPFSRRIITQCHRYSFLALGQLILGGITATLLSIYPIEGLVAATKEWWEIPFIGWAVAVCVGIIALSPIVGATVLASIYRNPAKLARRYRKNGKVFYSLANQPKKYVRVEVWTDTFGVSRRLFIPINPV